MAATERSAALAAGMIAMTAPAALVLTVTAMIGGRHPGLWVVLLVSVLWLVVTVVIAAKGLTIGVRDERANRRGEQRRESAVAGALLCGLHLVLALGLLVGVVLITYALGQL
ncbi:hypothetical protein [Curtobacterium sp. MCSS17_015]|uniref:hypothetical protein n=1 Tax=Curtobacterium sp. MCSS17_015 TaxID=2175666 RepID=UPI0011B64FD1|nr:hypothetical protein [Curtobacterium sp. MCSS17_015]WIB27034.1 hypothetical protein DEJ18_02760 [Curtobacterium sp. MCSS17_015]